MILDDPFPDPPGLDGHIPDASPAPQFADDGRLEDDWVPDEETRPAEEIEASMREKEAHNRAVVLEMIGDLPEADAAPPPNMLFICKLNPVTTEEDVEIIFSRFGTVTACDIIRDWKTGDSLCYGFIGFDSEEACEQAYFKMNNVLIDDRRIKVDFSQSVHHLWKQFKRFGRRGDAGLGKEADTHERQGRGRDLELKEHLHPGVGGRHGGGGGGRYELMLDDGDAERAGPRPDREGHRRQDDRDRRRRDGGRGDDRGDRIDGSRDRGRREREGDRDRRGRDRERSRERSRRHRSRSRERRRERSRERRR